MNEEERIAQTEKDFLEKEKNFKALFEYQQKNEDTHWKVRLSFVAFVGVFFTVVSANKSDFSDRFNSALSLIVVVAFTVMVIELIRNDLDSGSALKKQERTTKLSKVRHIAALEPQQFESYGKKAEVALIEDNSLRKRMIMGDPLSEIIKPSINNFFWFSLIIWPLLYLGLSALILLESLNYKP